MNWSTLQITFITQPNLHSVSIRTKKPWQDSILFYNVIPRKEYLLKIINKYLLQDFSGDPVVKTLCFPCRRDGFDP